MRAAMVSFPDDSPCFEMRNVRKRFGATVALAGVSLAVRPGEVHALVGQNGAGKSTLMKVLSGAHSPDEGDMLLEGKPYRPRNPLEARAAGVCMIYQELSLAPHLSVMENILLGMEPRRAGFLRWRDMRQRSQAALAQLGHAALDPRTPVGSLSPATQQIVEIARALAVGCRVLVLDEPTSSLTQADVQKLFATIALLKSQGRAIVYISHFLEEIKVVSDRFTVLRDGRTVGGGATADHSPAEIVTLMVGRRMDQLYPRSTRAAGDAVVELEGLTGRHKPSGVHLTLRRGEVVGISGLIGAGRTELLRALFALDPVQSGKVKIATVGPLAALSHHRPGVLWQQGVGLLSEDRKNEGLALNLSIADNLTLTDLKDFGPWGLVLPGRQQRAARQWIDALSIKCRDGWQMAADLSGGNQQKIALARLLHHDVDVLLLDEPTRGIDVASKAQIYQLIDQLAVGDAATGRKPKAVLMVSSYLPELLGTCDRIAVMCRGRLGPARPAAECTEHGLTLEATGQGFNA